MPGRPSSCATAESAMGPMAGDEPCRAGRPIQSARAERHEPLPAEPFHGRADFSALPKASFGSDQTNFGPYNERLTRLLSLDSIQTPSLDVYPVNGSSLRAYQCLHPKEERRNFRHRYRSLNAIPTERRSLRMDHNASDPLLQHERKRKGLQP